MPAVCGETASGTGQHQGNPMKRPTRFGQDDNTVGVLLCRLIAGTPCMLRGSFLTLTRPLDGWGGKRVDWPRVTERHGMMAMALRTM